MFGVPRCIDELLVLMEHTVEDVGMVGLPCRLPHNETDIFIIDNCKPINVLPDKMHVYINM